MARDDFHEQGFQAILPRYRFAFPNLLSLLDCSWSSATHVYGEINIILIASNALHLERPTYPPKFVFKKSIWVTMPLLPYGAMCKEVYPFQDLQWSSEHHTPVALLAVLLLSQCTVNFAKGGEHPAVRFSQTENRCQIGSFVAYCYSTLSLKRAWTAVYSLSSRKKYYSLSTFYLAVLQYVLHDSCIVPAMKHSVEPIFQMF